ncbi:MAG: hypothetical protein H0V44_10505 [Planctomycetes bacterium]|nr:hypothetical protein [Planctomycetota bacterium]
MSKPLALLLAWLCANASAAADAPAPAASEQAELTRALELMVERSEALGTEMTRLAAVIVSDATLLSGESAAEGAQRDQAEPGLYLRALDAQAALDGLAADDPARPAHQQRLLAIQKRIANVSADLAAAKARVHDLQVSANEMRAEFAVLVERLEALSIATESPPVPDAR